MAVAMATVLCMSPSAAQAFQGNPLIATFDGASTGTRFHHLTGGAVDSGLEASSLPTAAAKGASSTFSVRRAACHRELLFPTG